MILYVDATSAIFGVTNPPTITPYSFWYKYFAEPMTPGYSFAIILWLCVSIGKKEWLQLNGIISQMISNNKIKQKKQVYQTNIPQGKDKQQKNIPQHVKIKNTSISSHGEKKSGME